MYVFQGQDIVHGLPPEAEAFLKSQVGEILPQWGSLGLPPEAEAFWKVQGIFEEYTPLAEN